MSLAGRQHDFYLAHIESLSMFFFWINLAFLLDVAPKTCKNIWHVKVTNETKRARGSMCAFTYKFVLNSILVPFWLNYWLFTLWERKHYISAGPWKHMNHQCLRNHMITSDWWNSTTIVKINFNIMLEFRFFFKILIRLVGMIFLIRSTVPILKFSI